MNNECLVTVNHELFSAHEIDMGLFGECPLAQRVWSAESIHIHEVELLGPSHRQIHNGNEVLHQTCDADSFHFHKFSLFLRGMNFLLTFENYLVLHQSHSFTGSFTQRITVSLLVTFCMHMLREQDGKETEMNLILVFCPTPIGTFPSASRDAISDSV